MHDPEVFDSRLLSKRSKRKHARRGKPTPWRRMLLTSSQISIILSLAIILFSTTALFLSGVVIQKRTLEEIRIGIKTPKPTPKIYLPDRFRQSTTELKDGRVVIVDDDRTTAQQKKARVIEVRRTEEEATPRDEPAKAAESPPQREQDVPEEEEKVVPRTEMERNIQKQLEANMEHPDPRVADGRPITRAERRRLIKEEIQRLSHVEGPVYQRRLY